MAEGATCCLLAASPQLQRKGISARIGIYEGSIDRVTPNAKTGRADYNGKHDCSAGLPSCLWHAPAPLPLAPPFTH